MVSCTSQTLRGRFLRRLPPSPRFLHFEPARPLSGRCRRLVTATSPPGSRARPAAEEARQARAPGTRYESVLSLVEPGRSPCTWPRRAAARPPALRGGFSRCPRSRVRESVTQARRRPRALCDWRNRSSTRCSAAAAATSSSCAAARRQLNRGLARRPPERPRASSRGLVTRFRCARRGTPAATGLCAVS